MSDAAIVVVQNDQTLENRTMHGDASIDEDGYVTVSVASPTMLQTIRNITTAQLKAMHTTPITLIPAPGVGKCVVVFDAAYYMQYGGVPFDVGSNVLDINYRGMTGSPTITDDEYGGQGFSQTLSTNATNSTLCYSAEGGLGYVLPFADGENKDVILQLRSADMTTGNSTLRVKVRYQIVDTTF